MADILSEDRPPAPWVTSTPPLPDLPDTESSRLQLETCEECFPLLWPDDDDPDGLADYNANTVRHLNRRIHVKYLRAALTSYPARFTAYDASRPWLLYWSLTGLALLGEDVSSYRESVIATFRPLQNATGGFGGGHGQMSHLATTYAAVLSLTVVGGHDAYDLIDRDALWRWLGDLKQPDGSFEICRGGEIDVRAAYIATVVISLLNLPLALPPAAQSRLLALKNLTDGLPQWLSECQTYEGGISSRPGGEAHGAYAFCALACLCILDEPSVSLQKFMHMPSLINWLTLRQHAPEGGLAGRSNKLVDGCYSHWIGGCWALVEAAVYGSIRPTETVAIPPGLFNREALIRYILCCCQADRGGLRDKPSKSSDAYHSLYNLVGLSSAQNYYFATTNNDTRPLTAGLHWDSRPMPLTPAASPDETVQLLDPVDRVALINPVYVVPQDAAEQVRRYFDGKPLA